MGESSKEQTAQSQTKQLSGFVTRKIKILASMNNEGQVRAVLANLRRGVGKIPGELPVLWGILFQDFPEAFSQKAKDGKPSRAEWAAYLALTFYALHQQGHDITTENMQHDGEGLGTVVRRLVPDAEAEEKNGVLKRFQVMATSSDIEELAHHLRGIIQLLNRAGIGLDYGKLSEDLYHYQFEDSRGSVRLKWGREYFGSVKETAQDN